MEVLDLIQLTDTNPLYVLLGFVSVTRMGDKKNKKLWFFVLKIWYNTRIKDDGLLVTALATISYNDILKVSF